MVYLAAFGGLVTGFLAGFLIIALLLRGRTRQQLMEMTKDKGFRLKYGLITWFFALSGLFLFVWFYKN